MMKARASLIWCFWLLMPLPVRAQAQARPPDAPTLIDQGLTLREQGQDAAALDLFRRAWQLSPTPRAQAQVGLAEQALGLWLDAESHVSAALAAKSDPWIDRNRAPLDGALVTIRRHLGDLEVLGTPDGAEVSVNGRVVGTLPLGHSVRVVAGTSTLDVRAPGFLSRSRPVMVPPGGLSRESIQLLPETPLTEAQRPPSAHPRPVPEIQRTVAVPTTPETPPRSSLQSLGYVALGAAALFVAGGFAAYAVRESEVAVWNDDSQCLYRPNADETKSREANCSSHRQNYELAQSLEIAGFAIGGALAVTSAVLLLLPASRANRRREVALHFGAGPGSVGLSCAGRF